MPAPMLGEDGNEIRLIERSATITVAHRAKDVLRIGSFKPRENTRGQTSKLAIRSLQVMTR
jgi:hypothetical protein